MLSAAFDILASQEHDVKPTPNVTANHDEVLRHSNSTNGGFHCNSISTGLVLLADILPSLIIKITAPFYMQKVNYHIRIAFVVGVLSASLFLLAYSSSVAVSLLAVILASVSSGLGEITFLGLSSHFKKSTLSAWSSGTGMAGVLGSISYAGLLQIGLSKRQAVLFLLIVPLIFAIQVWVVLKYPDALKISRLCIRQTKEDNDAYSNVKADTAKSNGEDKTKDMALPEKLRIIFALKKYMIPLFVVYLAEYTINQGLYELLYYDVTWLTQAEQYRWFQVDYQIAVFISRSSVQIFQIKNLIFLSLGQCVLFVLLLLEVVYTFIPSIFVTLAIIFVEGLFGGAVYVNTFYNMSEEVDESIREFSLGAVSVSDSFGISISGGISIPLHNVLCKVKKS